MCSHLLSFSKSLDYVFVYVGLQVVALALVDRGWGCRMLMPTTPYHLGDPSACATSGWCGRFFLRTYFVHTQAGARNDGMHRRVSQSRTDGTRSESRSVIAPHATTRRDQEQGGCDGTGSDRRGSIARPFSGVGAPPRQSRRLSPSRPPSRRPRRSRADLALLIHF